MAEVEAKDRIFAEVRSFSSGLEEAVVRWCGGDRSETEERRRYND